MHAGSYEASNTVVKLTVKSRGAPTEERLSRGKLAKRKQVALYSAPPLPLRQPLVTAQPGADLWVIVQLVLQAGPLQLSDLRQDLTLLGDRQTDTEKGL